MRVLLSTIFTAGITLAYCGLLSSCASTTEESGALAAERGGTGYPSAGMPDFHAGKDAIAGLISAD